MLDNASGLGSCALAAGKKRKVQGQGQGQAVTAVVLCVAWELHRDHSPSTQWNCTVQSQALNQATTRAVTYRWRRSVAQLMIPADDGLWGS